MYERSYVCPKGTILQTRLALLLLSVLDIKNLGTEILPQDLSCLFSTTMLAPRRVFLLEIAHRLVRERGIAQPPEFWKLTDLEIERFIDTYLWDFVRRSSLKCLD